jgi:hypothetical protein
MLKSLSLLAVLVALVGATGSSAPAKGWPTGEVCGRTCFPVRGDTAGTFVWWWDDYSMPYRIVSPPRPAAFYRVALHGGTPQAISYQLLFVPSRHLVRIYASRTAYGPEPVRPYWRTLPAQVEPELRRIVAHVPPRPRPRAWPRVG